MSLVDLHSLWAAQAMSLAQLIADNACFERGPTLAEREAMRRQARVEEAQAVQDGVCSVCRADGRGVRLEPDPRGCGYLRCPSCGHLVNTRKPTKRKVDKRHDDAKRPHCPVCGIRRLARLIVDGVCVRCRPLEERHERSE